MATYNQVQLNYICDVAITQNLFGNDYSMIHERGLFEKRLSTA